MALRLAGLTAAAALTVLSAHGQTAEPTTEGTIYTPADFARFSPRTALDLVREVPGFQIEGTSGGRGLGQASGNVLLNGQRISSKSRSTSDALGRIPVDRVERLELVEASTLGIPGLSGQVVNVITQGGAISGVWEYEARFRERLEPRLNDGSVSVSGETGDISWTVGLEADANRFGHKGPEYVTDGDGTLLEVRNEDLEGQHDLLEGTLELNWTPPSGHEANLNASYAYYNFNNRLQGTRARIGEDPIFRTFRNAEDEWNAELGGDYALPIFGGRLKLIGVHRHEDSRYRRRVTLREADDMSFREGIRLDEDYVENEAIARAEFDWAWREGRDWQVAAESAYNRLDAGGVFFEAAVPGMEVPVDQFTPTLVEENRYEVSLTHSRPLSEKLDIQVSLSGEYSEISSEVGTDTQSESFVRPKGYVSATYALTDTADITLRLEREVGQLNFFDFVASQDINNGNDNAANRNIVPDQTWRIEAEIDRNYGDLGAAEFRLFHEEIEDLVDRVPLPGGGQGPGNLESATRSGANGNVTLHLDQFGLAGVKLELEGAWETSSVEDPVTGRNRPISENRVNFVFGELRWDIPSTDFAVLIAAEHGRRQRFFRLDETFRYTQTKPFAWAELEHKDIFGTTGFVRIGNLLDSTDKEERAIYSPDRSGPVVENYVFDRDFGYILTVGLSGSF
ncbi:MAG: TonB-dependent receptor plug domain-containing protein [Hyphomonadaceae bacterium]|nr:TonB-dependent receptor plug domain-containing protein [Hyphomonadaceae bacterium]